MVDKKKRLDQILVEKGLFPSRTRAQAAILTGLIFVNGQKVDKAGTLFLPEVDIKVKGEIHPYVSRGGVKLEHALREFKINVKDKICLDVGASTGGFTDCLLQNGAAKIYAVDVGYGQLAWKLRQNERVVVVEKTNVRYLMAEELYKDGETGKWRDGKQRARIAVIDVSFISLSKVLPAVYALLANKAEAVALIKPQFEARREDVSKGGIVRSEEVRNEVVEKVKTEAKAIGLEVKGVIQSPITGADGNVEFFVYLIKSI